MAKCFLEAWGTKDKQPHIFRTTVVFRHCLRRRQGQQIILFGKQCGFLALVPQASKKLLTKKQFRDPSENQEPMTSPSPPLCMMMLSCGPCISGETSTPTPLMHRGLFWTCFGSVCCRNPMRMGQNPAPDCPGSLGSIHHNFRAEIGPKRVQSRPLLIKGVPGKGVPVQVVSPPGQGGGG